MKIHAFLRAFFVACLCVCVWVLIVCYGVMGRGAARGGGKGRGVR